MKKILLLFLLLQLRITTADAQKRWEKAGEAIASANLENESILVTTPGVYQAIKFRASDAPIRITEMEIYFTTGDPQVLEKIIDIEKEGESLIVPLKGNRILKKIVFYYTILPNTKGNEVHLELYAMR